MAKKESAKSRSLREIISDRFTDTWKLLSETSVFLSKTPIFQHYEEQLRSWRLDLQNARNESFVFKRVRQEIIELRKFLRHQGYDLSLVRQNLVLEGFRNDVSMGEGFRRVVIFFGGDDVYWLAGDDNHVTLAKLLERQLYSCKHRGDIRSKHYLWYRRRGNSLVLSGSDTETKEDFERLKAMVELNSLLILAKLKNLS